LLPVVHSALLDEKADENEFEKFVCETRSLMLGAAYAVLRDHHDAEDAVINALTAIAKRFSQIAILEPKAKRAYAARSARNHALNILNARSRRQKNEELAGDGQPEPVTDGEIDALIDKIAFEDAVKCILGIDEKYRDVLYLYYAQGMTAEQVARTLALKRKTVETRIQRGKRLLAAVMKGETL